MGSNLRSATQMSMLFEQEDLRIGTPIVNIAKGVRKWARMTIRLLQQFTVGTRFVKYQKGYDDNLEWDKELINDNIHIKNINALVKSPAQQNQMMMDLINMKTFDEKNPYGYDNTLSILESFDLGHMKAEIAIPGKEDYEKSKRENHRATRGIQISVDTLVDDHSIHVREHAKYMKKEEYEEMLSTLTPEMAIQVEMVLKLTKKKKYMHKLIYISKKTWF